MISEELRLSRYAPLFKKDLREIVRTEVMFTLQAILENYEDRSYDINEIVADLKLRLMSYVRSQSREERRPGNQVEQSNTETPSELLSPSSSTVSNLSQTSQGKASLVRNRQFNEFFVELSMFFWNLSRSAGVWVMLLRQDQITSVTQLIDLYQFIRPVYNRMLIEGEKTCQFFRELCRIVEPDILQFLERVSLMVSDAYNQNKRLIVELIDELNTETKAVRLINKYMIYKLLRELSQSCFEEVRERLNQTVFRNVQPELLDVFTKYIIEKHELITFCNQQLVEEQIVEKEGLEEQLESKLLKKLSDQGKKVKFMEGLREDGERGLIVEVEKSNPDAQQEESYIVKLSEDGNHLQVMSALSVQKKWSFNSSKAITSPEDLIKERKSMVDALKSAPTNVKKAAMESSLETVGGSLGSCLANIRNYDSVGSFVVDFSSKTLVSGSLNYLVEKVPIMGYFLVAGGFTYSFYRVMRSKFKTTSKKIRDLGNMALDTGTSLGAGIIGGIVGEVVIPIPFLGMFVGSVIGGFLGNMGKDVMMKHLEGKRFEQIARYLDQHIYVEGYWQPTDQILQTLGVTRASFDKSTPEWLQRRQGGGRLWMTMLGFCLVSFYESQRDRKKLQQKMEQSNDDNHTEASENIEQYISLNLEMVVHYLESEDLKLRWVLPEVQYFMEKMFSG